ncbi:MAG: hypothetical protein ACI9XO_001240 [Paraglaciecola sp.]|jgi:hypothetical protein
MKCPEFVKSVISQKKIRLGIESLEFLTIFALIERELRKMPTLDSFSLNKIFQSSRVSWKRPRINLNKFTYNLKNKLYPIFLEMRSFGYYCMFFLHPKLVE